MAMEWSLQNDIPACQYRKFGCPKCGAKHKYGHRRQYISCWRCWYEFNPTRDGRKYEDERLVNLTPEERAAALKDINSTPPWVAKRKAKKAAAKAKREEAERKAFEALPRHKKLWIKLCNWVAIRLK